MLCQCIVRKIQFLAVVLVWGWLTGACAAEFRLTSGETLTGEAVLPTANDQGMQIKIGEGQYQKVPWGNFSQEDLKNFAKNSKLEPFVEPFIETNPEEKIKRTEVNLKDPTRLAQPPKRSLVAALFSSGLGFVMLLLVYTANVYAGYEISIFRAQPMGLVCGLAAIPALGFVSNIVFLSLPTQMKATAQAEPAVPEGAAAAVAASAEEEVNPMHADGAVHPTALKLAGSDADKGKSAVPETQVFQRGQYTFNRRFFETKFPGFFGVVRREADKDMLLVIRSSRGEYTTQRISRIAANDLHIQIRRGHATEEVLLPFQEIQELRLKHKDAA